MKSSIYKQFWKTIVKAIFLTLSILFIFPHLLPFILQWLLYVRPYLTPVVLFSLAFIVPSVPILKNFLKKWYKDNFIKSSKGTIGFLAVLLGVIFYFEENLLFSPTVENSIILFILIIAFEIIVFELITNLYLLRNKTSSSNFNNVKYMKVIDDLMAIKNPEEDGLDRTGFARNICNLIEIQSSQSMVYGVNGEWGSGKTSLVNMALQFIKENNEPIEIITLGISHYRSPDKIIYYLFHSLRKELRKYCQSISQISNILYQLGSTLTEVNLSYSIFNFGKFEISSLAYHQEKLSNILQTEFAGQIIIFLDDLDRTEKEELDAIFRTICLLSELPKIKFIVAYDKEQIQKVYFPKDKSLYRTANFLGKIIKLEFLMPIPPVEIRKSFLFATLEQIGNDLSKSDLFLDRIEQLSSFLDISYKEIGASLMELLKTPREIKKVCASIIWVYVENEPDFPPMIDKYCFLDLFMLAVIQLKLPKLYHFLNFESTSIQKELEAAFLVPQGASLKKVIDMIIKNFQGADEKEILIINNLVSYLFPEKTTYQDASKEKRLCCHDYYLSYFQYSYTAYLRSLNALFEGEPEVIADNLIKDEALISKDRYFIYKTIQEHSGNEKIIKSLSVKIATLSEKYIDGYKKSQDKFNIANDYARAIGYLLKLLPQDKIMPAINQIIKQSSSYGFAVGFTRVIKNNDNEQDINRVLKEKRTEYLSGKSSIEQIDFISLCYLSTGEKLPKKIREKLYGQLKLKENSSLLIKLFNIFINLDNHASTQKHMSTFNQNFPLKPLLQSIKEAGNLDEHDKIKAIRKVEEFLN